MNTAHDTFPPFGLGTVPLGNFHRAISDDDAQRVLHRAYELGVRYYDTAPLYGSGLAETRLGRFLTGIERESVLVSTKVGRLLSDTAPPDQTLIDNGVPIYRDVPSLNPYVDFSAAGVLASLQQSLERLQLDAVDVVYMHDPEGHEEAVIEEAYPTLVELRAAGALRRIGVGSTDVHSMVRLASELDLDCLMLASRWTLLERGAGDVLLPLCEAKGIVVVAAGVFNSGVLANPTKSSTFHYRTVSDSVLARVNRLAELTAKYGVPLKAAAIQFPRRAKSVSSVVVGAQTVDEIEEDIGYADIDVPDALWSEIERSYPDFRVERPGAASLLDP